MTIINRAYGAHKNLYISLFFTNNVWSYLQWPPVLLPFFYQQYMVLFALVPRDTTTGAIIKRTYGAPKKYIFPYSTNNIWSYLLWPPVILLRGTNLNRTYGTHKNLPGVYFYQQYLALFTMLTRNTRTAAYAD